VIPTDKLIVGLDEVAEKMMMLGRSAHYTKTYMETLLHMQSWYRPDKRRDHRLKRRGPCGHKWSHYEQITTFDDHLDNFECRVCKYRTWLGS